MKRKLYEIFKILQIQKRIVSAETIHGNTVSWLWAYLGYIYHLLSSTKRVSERLSKRMLLYKSTPLWTGYQPTKAKHAKIVLEKRRATLFRSGS